MIDQVTRVCPSMLKTIKLNKKRFLYMLDITIFCSLVIRTALNPRKNNFRLRIAHSSIEEHHVLRPVHSGGEKSRKSSNLRLKERHFVTHNTPTEKKARQSVMRSVQEERHRREVRQMRSACVDVPLCFKLCLKIYRTRRNLRG
jgi:hypothetical protein